MNEDIAGVVSTDELASPDMAKRYEAMIRLEADRRLGDDDLERLALRDGEPFIRKRALRMLTEKRAEGYLRILRQALQDDDSMVRIIAAEMLHSLYEEGERIRIVDLLAPLLRDRDHGVRSRVTSLLLCTGEKRAEELVVDLFIEGLERKAGPGEIARLASLVSMLKVKKVAGLLRKKLDRLDEEKRNMGLEGLEREGIDILRKSKS
jgi:HEAT repeat protein